MAADAVVCAHSNMSMPSAEHKACESVLSSSYWPAPLRPNTTSSLTPPPPPPPRTRTQARSIIDANLLGPGSLLLQGLPITDPDACEAFVHGMAFTHQKYEPYGGVRSKVGGCGLAACLFLSTFLCAQGVLLVWLWGKQHTAQTVRS